MTATHPPEGVLDRPGRDTAGDRLAEAFARDGFLGPVRVLDLHECRQVAAYLRRDDHPAPLDWSKGRAAHERFLYDIATRPTVLAPVTAILGDDVVLWGASAVSRHPGEVHPWHCDIESCDPEGGFVTAWIGVEHVSRDSALQMITRSHLLGRTAQEERAARGLSRERATAEELLDAVRAQEPAAELVQPEMTDGDALLFDGRLWHGSSNGRSSGQRVALLLQYAAADRAVRIPDLGRLDWPFRFEAAPRPPVILVRGRDDAAVNRLVPAPPPDAKGAPLLTTAVHRFSFPSEPAEDWQPFPAFAGPTRTLTHMSCHASVLRGGHSPHPPHAHEEEELLIPLRGEVELLIAGAEDDPAPRVERLRPGAFVYYPAGQHHTIRNPGADPVTYLMLKWQAPRADGDEPLATRIVDHGDVVPPVDAPGFWTHTLLEGPTSCLGRLQAHLTVLEPGAGYAPHVDAHDVALVLLAGTVETAGTTVAPFGAVYHGAGEPHGIVNAGTEAATYLAFELHGRGSAPLPRPAPAHRRLAGRAFRLGKRVTRPARRRLRPHLARLRGR